MNLGTQYYHICVGCINSIYITHVEGGGGSGGSSLLCEVLAHENKVLYILNEKTTYVCTKKVHIYHMNSHPCKGKYIHCLQT